MFGTTVRILLFLLAIALSTDLWTQVPQGFERINTTHGLSDDQAIRIHQDQEGFIWIGTMSGLNRFDGTRIKTFTRGSAEDNTMFNHRIMDMHEDNFGNLWLNSFGGVIQAFNKRTHKVRNFPLDFGHYPLISNNAIYLDDSGFAVLAFDQLGVFVIETGGSDFRLIGEYLFDEKTLQYDTFIFSVHASDRHNIWLNTRSGPIHLEVDPQQNKAAFSHLAYATSTHESGARHLLKDSILYFGVSGLGLVRYEPKQKKKEIIPEVAGVDLSRIHKIGSRGNQLWLSVGDGALIGLSADGRQLSFSKTHYGHRKLGQIRETFMDSRGKIWFRSMGFQGIFRYTPHNDELVFLPCNFSNSQLISKTRVISFFHEDRNGNIWMGTKQNGVLFYERAEDQLVQITNDPANPQSLISNGLLSICEDKGGNIWLGTQFGISKVNINKKEFVSIRHTLQPRTDFDDKTDALYQDSHGNIWCSAFTGELYVYDENFQLRQVFSGANKSSGFRNAIGFSLLEDSRGRLWIGSKGEGLFMLDLKKYHNRLSEARFSHFQPEEGNPYSIHSNDIYDILEDQSGRIWLATYGGGLDLILENSGDFRFMSYNQFLEPFCPFVIDFGRCLLEDSNGKIWYGGLNGLCSFSVDEEDNLPVDVKFYYYDPEENNSITYSDIKTLYEDREGRIWIGTYGGGLNVFDPKTRDFEHFLVQDGLSNNIVYGIIGDQAGNLWISTKNGLSKYLPARDDFINFSVSDGLPTNEFTEASPFRSGSKLYFGTIKGLTYFQPEKIKPRATNPDILFTNFLVSNKELEVTADGPLNSDINQAEEVRLKYHQNNFSLSFSTTDYQTHKQARFAYKLENFDSEWTQADNDQYITYTNIPPGNYRLKVRLSEVGHETPVGERILQLRVTPPFWKSTSAYLLYGLLLLGLALLSIRLLRQFNALRNSLKLEKEITAFKLKFFTNISHELRTPLTLIINPIREIFTTSRLNDPNRQLLQLAHNNASKLLVLVNEILDFRKLQTNSIRLKVSENEVVSFFNQVTEDFRFVAEKNGLSYEKEANLSERKYWFDPEKLEKIIINLLTNAFKFTEPGGSVSIRLFAEAHQFSITIEDSGKGFAPDKRNKVFERYYKVERANRNFFSQGAGIGLSLIEEFVKLHKGQIDLYSEPGYGTRFKISIPGNKNAYTPDERAQSGNWTAGRESGNIARFYQSPKLSQPLPFPTASRHRILLVEDNREMLEMLAVKLHRHFEVLQAQNGREGLAIISQSPPELVVTDLLMPEMNGIELAKAVKSDFQTCHIPVIMLTAKAALENKVEGYETGADAYMTKPFDFEVLIARINNLLEQRKRLRQKFVDDLHMESRSVAIEKKDQEFIDSVISTVIDHLDNNQFTLQELYRELGYSKTVFYNKIKALTDLNPSQFVRMIKLKEAAKLLKATDLNISEIAYNIGYSDVNYFRIQFKKQFKTTPKAFRDEHLGVGF